MIVFFFVRRWQRGYFFIEYTLRLPLTEQIPIDEDRADIFGARRVIYVNTNRRVHTFNIYETSKVA